MQLQIEDPKDLLQVDFIQWLKVKIRNKIISDIDDKKLIVWDEYFNTNANYVSIYKKKISSKDIIIAGASNLDFSKSESTFSIFINRNVFTPGLNQMKLETICKVINFGDLQLKGYPIFTDTFDYFAESIHDYVDRYLHGLL